MITELRVEHFKAFDQLEIPLRRLTVLTGVNGGGKSTVVQAISLAHRASTTRTDVVSLLDLNGVDLGEAVGAIHANSADPSIKVGLSDANGLADTWRFDQDPDVPDGATFLRVTERPHGRGLLGRTDASFVALSAERLGPRVHHLVASLQPGSAAVGHDGRFAAHALASSARTEVDWRRRHRRAGTVKTLKAQVEAWMSTMIGEVQVESSVVPRVNVAELRFKTGGRLGDWLLPTSTGFGVSYTFPVVVAGLLIRERALFVVDSPEAHLHPASQSAMGLFLATIAGSGVQVIVETHSDHVMNGIRRAASVEGLIKPSDVQILFFPGGGVPPQEVQIDERGKLSGWPAGFFDQLEQDLAVLAFAARRR